MGIWGALLWKEWLGLRWKIAALGVIPAAMLLFEAAFDPSLIPLSFVAAVMSYVAIAPIFLAMHAAAAERADGTLEFVRGLPCRRRQMGLVRVLATLGALLAPLLGTAALAYGLMLAFSHWGKVPPHDFTGPEGAIRATIWGLASAASIYLWTTALAMNEPSELRTGAIGVGTVVVLGALSFFLIVFADQWERAVAGWRWLYVLAGVGPFASIIALDEPHIPPIERVILVLVQVATSLLLVVVAVNRYANLERRSWGIRNWLSSSNQALVWAQWRQVVPLGVLSIVMVLALSLAPNSSYVLAFLGSVWAIVAGVTMFAAELEPRLYAFWRSRPIDPSAWFCVKYLAGAAILLACFDLPAALLGQVSHSPTHQGEPVVVAYSVCVPLLHLAAYSIAVMIVCLVRQAIYAGILSMSAMLLLTVLPTLQSNHHDGWWMFDVQSMMFLLAEGGYSARTWSILPGLLIYLTFNAIVIAAATLAAWWFVRGDVAVRA
jgi:ABC-type transport system involved in multi-copper enzyme maturation permease subunit